MPPNPRKRVFLVGIPIVALLVALGVHFATRAAHRQFEHAATMRLTNLARRASETVDQFLRDQRSGLRLLASMPDVVNTARAAGADARRLGLDRQPTSALEAQYSANRALRPDAQIARYLREFRDASDYAEIFFTERHGLVVASSNLTSDFVQSDELWWRLAFDGGRYQGEAGYDESATVVVLELAARITDPTTGEPLGVVRGLVALTRLPDLVARSDEQPGLRIEVVDSVGRALATADASRLLRAPPDAAAIPRSADIEATTLRGPTREDELVATAPVVEAPWWIVIREAADTALATAHAVERAAYVAAGFILVLVVLVMLWITDWYSRTVSRPVQSAGNVARRIAQGDLSVSVASGAAGSQEVLHLLTSVQMMVQALRDLVGQMRVSSEESAAMAEEISASTQQMTASTQQMATTCQELTAQATEQSEMVRVAASDAARILNITTQLADGSRIAAERNMSLLETAEQHRKRLIEGSAQLAELASDLERGAAEAEQLATMSEEIEKFVSQARAIAAQTNMLALNAAIEASRAGGGEGRGFAVVADEVRKLATQAARAAASTSETVENALATVQATRDRLTRLAQASVSVREIAESAVTGLRDVEGGAAETSAWTEQISGASAEVRRLVEEISERLDTVSRGTEAVVAAAEEIAASAQQQSASTEEIAGSAAQLAEAAERLTSVVSSFKLAKARGMAGPTRTEAAREQSAISNRSAFSADC